MGRQRLYHTAEEKLAANRAKSKRHYEKYALLLFIYQISHIHNSLEIKIQSTNAGGESIRKRIKRGELLLATHTSTIVH
jgi:hypothetical protein